jgi:isorenieratene synthase
MAHSPLRRGLGTDIRTGAPVRGVHPDDTGGVQVRTDDTLDRYDAAVLALDPGALRGVIAASAELGTAAWRDDIAATTTAPLPGGDPAGRIVVTNSTAEGLG